MSLDIPECNAGNREGSPVMQLLDMNMQPVMETATYKNLVWSLTRLSDTTNQSISSWTGFNVTTRDNISVCKDTIGYLPTINAPATQLSKVHHVTIQAANIKDELNIQEIA